MNASMHMKTMVPTVHASLARSIGTALAVGALVLAFGIGEAAAQHSRGGGAAARGGGGGGRMAQSSVSSANRGNVNTGNVNRGNVNTGNVNTGNVNRGNVNTGNINTGNVNIGNDVNINIDNDYHGGYHGGYYGGVRYPVAAGVVIGAMAVTTAAVMGSYYHALPPSCTVVVRGGVSYHYCGSVYYKQTWSGNDVVYVVVSP